MCWWNLHPKVIERAMNKREMWRSQNNSKKIRKLPDPADLPDKDS
jgi:hypothetical protein